MLDGNSAMSLDGFKTWIDCHEKGKRGMDFAVVDWNENPPKTILGLGHERNGVLLMSTDVGKTWKDLGTKFTALGMFAADALVATKGDGILRSEDGGANWTKVSDLTPAGGVVASSTATAIGSERKASLSKDKGKTWAVYGSASPPAADLLRQGRQIDARRRERGLSLTTDAGQTWKIVAPHPPERFHLPPRRLVLNYGWDPVNNIIYASRMGKKAFRFRM